MTFPLQAPSRRMWTQPDGHTVNWYEFMGEQDWVFEMNEVFPTRGTWRI